MASPDYSDISPVDLRNPFRNPTEEPDYSPPYSEIIPELKQPGSRITLFPTPAEKRSLRKNFDLICLILLFGFLISATLTVLLRMGITMLLRQTDGTLIGELPQNYMLIAEQYMDDSTITFAVTTIAFLIGNLTAFLTGCKLTRLKKREMFRLRSFSFSRSMLYLMLGLWIQLVMGYAANFVIHITEKLGIPVYQPELHTGGTLLRTGVMALYCCLVAPVTEELLLRGFVLKNASRVSQRFGIFFSAFLFALLHENLPQFLAALPMGILLGYITVRHNSLAPAIMTHIAVNSIWFVLDYAEQSLPQETFRMVSLVYLLAVLLLGTAAFFYMLLTERLPDQTPHQSIRGRRILFGAPLFWALVCVHLAAAIYATL